MSSVFALHSRSSHPPEPPPHPSRIDPSPSRPHPLPRPRPSPHVTSSSPRPVPSAFRGLSQPWLRPLLGENSPNPSMVAPNSKSARRSLSTQWTVTSGWSSLAAF
ncbi:unnamed protein product [Chondrus crispus]|uniref:Uncharacterized protein n=1 Tax=Chondrus crispus TaxID=2769 RepID=R7QDW5_CHOCR|nr:unnamed protein product [Chondrus crispus]CDF36279.1 unnamed protein product [Chondrus crispus]|eukprot:XP_005716098.1 unnamed protein product [Chondrus crispus]